MNECNVSAEQKGGLVRTSRRDFVKLLTRRGSVACSQIDGSTADNIIVGSGPGIPSEVKVFSSKLPSSPGTAPARSRVAQPSPLNAGIIARRVQRRLELGRG